MRSKLFLFLLLVFVAASMASGQKANKKIVITGVVKDAYQAPVQGAEIIIDGEKSGVSTDKRGEYKIKIQPSVKKIGIYTLPPAIITEPIAGRTYINFILNDSIVKQITRLKNEYGDELVDVGYGTQKRKNVTSAVSKVDARKERYASYNSIYELIRAEVPQVQVTGTSIRIREASSVNESTQPLFVVDGVPTNSLDGIQPQMVRSIDVLRGSAASIYGTRGSNGVLIISTSDTKR